MPRWHGGPTGRTRLGSPNEAESGLDLRPVKNVNLLKDIAVLPLSILFGVGKTLILPIHTHIGSSHGLPHVHALHLVQVLDNLGIVRARLLLRAL